MLKVTTWNCNGLKAAEKRTILYSLCRENDIVCVQETHTTVDSCSSFFPINSPFVPFWSHGDSHSRGVLTVLTQRTPISLVKDHTAYPLSNGRYIDLELSSPLLSKPFRLLNLYTPADCDKERAAFFSQLPVTDNTMLVGDFNVVLSPLDRTSTSSTPYSPNHSSRSLSNLCSKHDLHDSWRYLHPNKVVHSFHRGEYSARLDRIITPQWMIPLAKSVHIQRRKVDHSPVTLTLNLSLAERGHDRFFFNTSLLEMSRFRNALLDHIKKLYTFVNPRLSPADKWEWLKAHILSFIQIQSPIFAAERRANLMSLRRTADNFDALLHADPHNRELRLASENNHAALTEEENYQLRGAALRSQYFRHFVHEQVPKHIAKLAEHKANSQHIPSLVTDNNLETTNTDEMLTHARTYWGKVFHSPEFGPFTPTEPKSVKSFLQHYERKPNPIPDTMLANLGSHITAREVDTIIRSLPMHRSNGPDGLPYEIYADEQIWELISGSYIAMLNYSISHGILPESMRECDVVLLHKKGSRNKMSNYRPISVLNCDYRIFARILVARLNPAATLLVHPDQTGFIKGRLISDNGILLTSLIEYAEYDPTAISGAMIFLDFEKAFDSVEWDWLFATLAARGLPTSFINMVKTMYNAPRASVIVNGFRATHFITGRGVRQGCPLSPLLFALSIEPLADAIRNDLFLLGVKIPRSARRLKISLFADDATVFILNIHDWLILKSILFRFSKASGLKLNDDKLEGFWLSPDGIPPKNLIIATKWLKKGELTRVLGYRLGLGLSPDDQHQHVIEKIRTRLVQYCPRIHSPSARVILLKMCIHSLLWYFVFVTPITSGMLKFLNRWCYNFLWRKYAQPLEFERSLAGKVSRSVLALPRALGGLNYQPLETQLTALRIKWIRQLLDVDHQAAWKEVVLSRIHDVVKPWLPRSPHILLSSIDIHKSQPPYLRPIFLYFKSLKPIRVLNPSRQEILQAPLFFNKDIPQLAWTSKATSVRPFRQWACHGVTTVQDLFDPQGAPFPITHLAPYQAAARAPKRSTNWLLTLSIQHEKLLSYIPLDWLNTLAAPVPSSMLTLPAPNFARLFGLQLHLSKPIPLASMTPALLRGYMVHLTTSTSQHAFAHVKWNLWYKTSDSTWVHIWRSLRSPTLSTTHRSFLWLLAHYALKVGKHSLVKKLVLKQTGSLPRCPHCSKYESIPHSLYDCRNLQLFWRRVTHFSAYFLHFIPSPSLFRRQMLLGDFALHAVPQESRFYDAWLILRACALHTVWTARCKYVFHPQHLPTLPRISTKQLYFNFLAQLSTYANAHFLQAARGPSSLMLDFAQLWLPGLLCSYIKPAIHIHPPKTTFLTRLCKCPPTEGRALPEPDLQKSELFDIPLSSSRKRCRCGAPPSPFGERKQLVPVSYRQINEHYNIRAKRRRMFS